jgi:L-2,4-diaminobutyrate decarboxylase
VAFFISINLCPIFDLLVFRIMQQERLKTAFEADSFKKIGHQLIDDLAEHLDRSINDSTSKTLFWNTPQDEANYWKDVLENGSKDQLFDTIIKRSIHIHNPKYIGHQVNPTLPITGLSSMLSSILNNGMGVYEMGVAATAIEKVITDLLCKKVGWNANSTGFLTSGGTMANITALLGARQHYEGNIWKEGNPNRQIAIMVSKQAHYCVDRAARIMGLGEKGVIKIPVNSKFCMDLEALQQAYQTAKNNNIDVIAIVGSAPSTATGMFDNLDAIANFCQEQNIWFHIDAAHGGGAIFSKKYKSLLKGSEHADSIVIDGHKMCMMPALNTALLFYNGQHSYNTFAQTADYLLTSSKEDWYNLAKRTFECTKHMMSIHWMTILKYHGEQIFDDYVTTVFDLGEQFYDILKSETDFEVLIKPMSNIICFRYVQPNLNSEQLNEINNEIRQRILEDGKFYIVQTTLNQKVYLRMTIMNPFTTISHFKDLLQQIRTFA